MIPALNLSGVLPPYTGASPVVAAGLSPYDTSMKELAETFGTSHDRAVILRGMLALRARLTALGITTGYQWCGGSFCEDVEKLRGRSPDDMDIVTFFVRPAAVSDIARWRAVVAANVNLFDAGQAKATFHCDAYYVDSSATLGNLIGQVTYWYGLFAHQRSTHMWKGMLRIPLISDDADALNHLARAWP